MHKDIPRYDKDMAAVSTAAHSAALLCVQINSSSVTQ